MEFLQITKTLQRLSKKTLLEQNLSILFKINTYFKIYHWERTFGSVTNQHFTLISRDTGSFICPRKNQGKIISSSSKIPSTKWTSAYQPWDNPPKSSGGQGLSDTAGKFLLASHPLSLPGLYSAQGVYCPQGGHSFEHSIILRDPGALSATGVFYHLKHNKTLHVQ